MSASMLFLRCKIMLRVIKKVEGKRLKAKDEDRFSFSLQSSTFSLQPIQNLSPIALLKNHAKVMFFGKLL